jgi:hypothetical protein
MGSVLFFIFIPFMAGQHFYLYLIIRIQYILYPYSIFIHTPCVFIGYLPLSPRILYAIIGNRFILLFVYIR